LRLSYFWFLCRDGVMSDRAQTAAAGGIVSGKTPSHFH
jgi:hypothetical protein